MKQAARWREFYTLVSTEGSRGTQKLTVSCNACSRQATICRAYLAQRYNCPCGKNTFARPKSTYVRPRRVDQDDYSNIRITNATGKPCKNCHKPNDTANYFYCSVCHEAVSALQFDEDFLYAT